MWNIGKLLTVVLLVSACANSADHEVVAKTSAADALMSCSDIKADLFRVQAIKDGVQKDKDDMTGADVVDGLLWFPFNVRVKHSNYSNAMQAADARAGNLRILANQKGCDLDAPDQRIIKSGVEGRLAELEALKKKGLITDEEYVMKRKTILDEL